MNARTFTLAALLSLSSACTLQQLTPASRLSESVYQLNDMSRWGQTDMAVQMVSPRYKELFRERRRDWGEGVNIAEIELTFQQLSPDKSGGTSEIAMSWTDAAGVFLHKSVIVQRWAKESGSFRLVEEKIKKGDPNLFAAAPQLEARDASTSETPATSGP